MRMGLPSKTDKRGKGVSRTAIFAATEPGAAFALSGMNCMANKTRIRYSWTISGTSSRQASRIDDRQNGTMADKYAGPRNEKCTGNDHGVA